MRWLSNETVAHLRRVAEWPDLGATKYRLLGELGRGGMLEPMLSLLAPEEQRTIARRFPFDPIRWGRITSWALLTVGVVEAGASLVKLFVGRLGIADAAWLLAGGFLALEQVRRLRILRSGSPAGSVLGVLVRPLARPLFSARPVGG